MPQQIHAPSGLETSDLIVGGVSWEWSGGPKSSPWICWTLCFGCSPGYSWLFRLIYSDTTVIIWYTQLSFLFLINYLLAQNFTVTLQVMAVRLVLENIPVFHTSAFKVIHTFLFATSVPLSISTSLLSAIGAFCLGMLFSVPQTRALGQYLSVSLSHSCLFPFVCSSQVWVPGLIHLHYYFSHYMTHYVLYRIYLIEENYQTSLVWSKYKHMWVLFSPSFITIDFWQNFFLNS